MKRVHSSAIPIIVAMLVLSVLQGRPQGVGQALLLRYDGPTDNNSELRYLIGDPAPTGSTTAGNPNFPNSPTTVAYVSSLLSPLNIGVDRFGYLMTGYLRPTNTGYYRFAVASDDPGIFYLSTNANPANLRVLCYTQGSSGTGNFNNAGHRRAQSGEIQLEAGQLYYFEAVQRDNTGGDGLRIGWQPLGGSLTNVQNSNAGIPGTFLTTAPNPGAAGFYSEPADTTVEASGQAIFEALFDGEAPFDFEWFVDGVGQGPQRIYTRRSVLVLTNLTVLDSGKTVSLSSTNALGAATSSNATLTVVDDTTPPSLFEAIGALASPNTFLLTFSEPINAAIFTPFEIVIGEGASEGWAVAQNVTADPADARRFTVTTDVAVTNGTFVRVTSVSDLNGNSAANLTKTLIMNEGMLRRQVYTARTGGNLNDLINDPNYPTFPAQVDFPTTFSTLRAFGDNYGARLQGYIRVGRTGDYRIGIASDDNSALYLSPDSNPANAQPICGVAYWSNVTDYNKHRMQQSIVHLTEGVMHYIEVMHKEGTGGDGLEVAMVPAEPLTVPDAYPRKYNGPIPNGTAPLSGVYLNPYRENISLDPTLPADIVVTGECMPAQTLQIKLLSGAITPGQAQWYNAADDTPITDATNITLSLPPPLTNGMFYCVVGNDINTVTSRVATVGVPVYSGGPKLVSAAAFDASTVVGLTFDRTLDRSTSTEVFNYSVEDAVSGTQLASVLNAEELGMTPAPLNALSSGGTRYILQLNAPVTPPFKVKVSSLRDCGGRDLDPTASEYLVESWGAAMSIGLTNPAVDLQGTNFPINVGNVDVRVPGADIWNTADQFHFVYKLVSGDFDVRVKTPYLERPDVWAKSGLMVRESLNANSRMLYAVTADYTTAGYAQHALGRRDATGAGAAGWPSDPRPGVPRENSWVRLKRVGSTFYSYQSTNGVYWQPVSSYTPAWGGVESGPLYLGICTTSHNQGLNTTAKYSDYGPVTYPSASINIVQQPIAVSTPQGTKAAFQVVAEVVNAPQYELTYQWQRSDGLGGFTNVPGATTASLQTGFLTVAADNGVSYRVVMNIPGVTTTSAEALLTVQTDTLGPKLLYAVSLDLTHVTAAFDEPIAAASGDAFFWELDGGIAISGATVNTTNSTRVDLVLDAATPLVAGTSYTLSAGTANGNVTDLAGNATVPNPATATFVGVADYLAGWVNPQMAVLDSIKVLPTSARLPIGAKTDRGFDCRMVQITNAYANDPDVAEQVLAGTYLVGFWPFQQSPGPNFAGLPSFVETNEINYNWDANQYGHVVPDKPFPGIPNPAHPGAPTLATDYMSMEALTYLSLTKGMYRFGVNSDDGFRVTPATNATDTANAVVLAQFVGGRGTADSTFDVVVPEDGLYPFRLVWEQGNGGANVEFWTYDLQTGTYTAVNNDSGVLAFRPSGGAGVPSPVLSVSLANGNVTICFADPGCAGCTYTLQRKADLAEASWTDDPATASVNGGNVCFTVPADQVARFYQVKVTP